MAKAKETRLKTMEAAIEAVAEGQSVRSAAKAFGIPYSTLQDHVSGKNESMHDIY